MEEKKKDIPKMSEFCESIMERTEELADKKGDNDCAIIMCCDGNTMACRIAGTFLQLKSVIVKKMFEDPAFAQLVCDARYTYDVHMILQMKPTLKTDMEEEKIAKEVSLN